MIPRTISTPRDASLFCTSLSVVLALLSLLLWWKGRIPVQGLAAICSLAALLVATAWIRPAWVQPIHRAAMAFARGLSLVLGPVLLTVVYWVAVVPLGLLLRAMAKDLLRLKHPGKESLWHPVKPNGDLNKMF